MPRGVYPRKRRSVQTDRPTERVFPVSAIDYPGLLAQLEQQDRAIVQEREDLAVIIDAVRKRARVVVPSGLSGNGQRANQHAKTIAPDDAMKKARPLYERGDAVTAVAKAVGRTAATIYTWASKEKWARPKGHAAKPDAAPVPDNRTKLAGSVRCTNPDCGVYTDYDPCTKCGKALKRRSW